MPTLKSLRTSRRRCNNRQKRESRLSFLIHPFNRVEQPSCAPAAHSGLRALRRHDFHAVPSVLIGRIRNAFSIQIHDKAIQSLFPMGAEPLTAPKPFNKRRADSIVYTNKHAPRSTFLQFRVTETPQRPDSWAIIRAVNAGRNVASLMSSSIASVFLPFAKQA